MAAIPEGPNLANRNSNRTLNDIAPDPGALAIGQPVTPEYKASKRKRIKLIQKLDTTIEEVETGHSMMHAIEHRALLPPGSYLAEV